MEKIVAYPGMVEDIAGLYLELRKAAFDVVNVGADERGTYVYLGEEEEKDPLPLVESWIGKPAPRPNDIKMYERRMEETVMVRTMEESGTLPEDTRDSFLTRLFKRFF